MKKGFFRQAVLCLIVAILQLFCTTQEGTLVGNYITNGVVKIVEQSHLNARVFINHKEYAPLQNGSNHYNQESRLPVTITLFHPGYGFSDTVITISPTDTTIVRFMLVPSPSGSVTIHADSGVSVLINNISFVVTTSKVTQLTDLPGGISYFSFSKGSSAAAESLSIVADSNISFTPFVALAQHVLIEHFSNVSCDGCPEKAAVLKEVLDSFNSPLISKISFHASWPSRYDPLYVAAKDDQDSRVNYYKQWALPLFIVNGSPIVYNPASKEELKAKLINAITENIEQPPHYSMAIHLLPNDSGNVVIHADYSALNALTLRIAAVQGSQEFASPPGTNGETYFSNVFKGFYKGNTGVSVSCGLGESVTVPFKIPVEEYPENDLWYYAWLQDDTSQEIVQVHWIKYSKSEE